MSTDPTEPAQPAPPTVKSPSAQWGQEPPTQATPAWQPPPPPPPAPPGRQEQPPAQPTVQMTQRQPVQDAPSPGQWRRPAQDTPPPGRWQPPVQDTPPPGQWQQPQPGWQQPPAQPPVQQPPTRFGRKRRRRRMRRSFMALFTVIVLAILLVIGDRVANAVAENDMASQFTSNGFPVKPSVTIEGFPFLTQLAAKDFKKVDISASNVPAGPVTISSVHATLNGMHISSLSSNASARVDHMTATAFISFGELAAAGGLGGSSGITVTPDGQDKLKISASLGGVLNASEEAKITQTGPQTISVEVINNGTAVGSLLSSFGSFSFTLPKGVPATLRITGVSLNSQGLTLSAAASNATFSK